MKDGDELASSKGIDYDQVARRIVYCHELRARYMWRLIRRLARWLRAIPRRTAALAQRSMLAVSYRYDVSSERTKSYKLIYSNEHKPAGT